MYSRMLVPIDASEPSKLALHEAIKLAQALSASICLVHVVNLQSLLTSEATGGIYETFFDIMRRDGERLLRETSIIISKAAIKVDSKLVETPDVQVGECIVREARGYKADLIICGTHGRRGMHRLLMGSDAEYVVRHSPVPVLLVRAGDTI